MNQFPGLVDSHFHSVSMRAKGVDVSAALSEFWAQGGAGLLDVAVDVESWDERAAFADPATGHRRLWLSAGVHPSEADRATAATWDTLQHQVKHPRVVAVGEIGLDWYRGTQAREAQFDALRRQLLLAMANDLPVIIHNREADSDLLEQLGDVGWKGRGVFHCFSSNRAMAEAGLERGFWISFAGNVTYPSSSALRDVAAAVPAERILVETDSPYLSPQGLRGRPNQPVHAGVTAAYLAQLRGVPLAEFLEQTRRNFETLFRVDTH